MSGSASSGKRVAILVENEFDDRELMIPFETLQNAGVVVTIVGPTSVALYSVPCMDKVTP